MSRAIAHSGADVILATAFPFMHMYDALTGGRRAGIPVVFLGAIHVADAWDYDRRMIFRAIRQVDAYVAHTPFERDYLIEHGVQAAKIAVIGGGVDAGALAAGDGSAVRRQQGWQDEPVVGVLARQSQLKRLDIVLAAMPQVWARQPEARLLLAGARTSYSPQIEALISALPPEQRARVTMVSDFPESQKADLLAACDLLAHPSANESFGIALVEAWACGKPVIGVRQGAVGSVIDDGRDGLLVDYLDANSMAQAILALLADPARRQTMGQAGRQKVLENYTWQIISDRLRAVYEDLVSPTTTPG
jgi:glycosyltransferase involved in cell wall biosynthesis